MSERDKLLASIATTAKDYQVGKGKTFDAAHVDKWASQFPDDAQLPVLRELDHVLKQTYISRANVEAYLRGLLSSEGIAGKNPKAFWSATKFLDIQGGGGSQSELLDLLDSQVKSLCGIGVRSCGGSNPTSFAYVDDVLASGGRITQDLTKWIAQDAPSDCDVHVIVMAHHSNGGFQTNKDVEATIAKSGKKVRMHWWSLVKLENQRKNKNESDVLWPSELPNDPIVQEFVDELKQVGYPPELRDSISVGSRKLFSGVQERRAFEQHMLLQSAKILKQSPGLRAKTRPLGNSRLKTLGTGSMIVTYRNCPNNAPVALWAGDPWYPLFPRTSNQQTKFNKLMANLFGGAGRRGTG